MAASDLSVKDLQEGVSVMKDDLAKAAEHIVTELMPRKIIELSELITSPAFSLRNEMKPSKICIESKNNAQNEHTPRKRVRTSSKTEETSHEFPAKSLVHVQVNTNLSSMLQILKVQILSLVEHCNAVKIWIQLNIPRIEDGNNFGVSIQEETVNELSRAEDNGFAILESITKYYVTRGKLVSKVLKYPHLDDYVRSVEELDEKELLNLKLCLIDLRNNYAILYDMITKNMEKIKKPRSTNLHNTMY